MKKQVMVAKYDHHLVEKNKYDFWTKNNFFKCDNLNKDNKPNFSILMPPPNVTGKLHIGHAWDNTLQDLLIRYKKLDGFNTLWIPGMDHAGIATQVKVLERLSELKNISLEKIDKEMFLKHAWGWKEEYAQIIRQQWGKLGLGVDYDVEKFTLDNDVNEIVIEVFCELYNQKLIYKDKKIVSLDPKLKTAISNIEVNYKECISKMYYFKYYLEDKTDYLVVGTTRPETMFGDQAVFVNPNDKRFTRFIGKKLLNPVNNELLPIIADDYVSIEFGSGAMKCTPAHDENDFELGKKYNLKFVVCMNVDGTMNELANQFAKQDRFVCRKNLVQFLESKNLVEKIEEHNNKVGYSERTGQVIEPYLSDQWFLKVKSLTDLIIKLQKSKNKIVFLPELFNNNLLNWVKKTQDWCISRQLWWGHQIPAWYHKTTKKIYVGKNPPKDIENWEQDSDVLDTWFSSVLWPMIATGWKTNETLFKNFFPTNTLVTGYDIIFFWVSRMIYQSLKFVKDKPFNNVLIHGLIRDAQGNKMSKSLGNGVDPNYIIDKYGADALRFFLVTNSSPGQDIRFSEDKIANSWNFINKLWNAARYIQTNINVQSDFKKLELSKIKNPINQSILMQLCNLKQQIQQNMNNYEFMLVGKEIYHFVWDDFCSWYIEFSKVNLKNEDKDVVQETENTLSFVLLEILILLHPFIPFVTEDIYQNLTGNNSILLEINHDWNYECDLKFINHLQDIISAVRNLRKQYNIKYSQKIDMQCQTDDLEWWTQNKHLINDYLKKIINTEFIEITNKYENINFTPIVLKEIVLFVETNQLISKDEKIEQLNIELNKIASEIKRSENILTNSNFINKASTSKVKQEQKKFENYKIKHQNILEQLNKLK
ncbi:valine--tRNA ligase [Spiroplasma endosymbiont of Amphibalanus improvisus]|uniref:valine--tRNA ligase n=1 Tax=Spiroplasma endosymbiont of Amphibalanus improvisus TaxID=3066327 RepID=UPI00313BD373